MDGPNKDEDDCVNCEATDPLLISGSGELLKCYVIYTLRTLIISLRVAYSAIHCLF